MLNLFRKRMRGQKGFTLIELLVVIIIIAILAAIAIPTFLGQREKAQDSAAKSLVRNAMTAIETAYVDLQTFNPVHATKPMTGDVLHAIEPSIVFTALADAATTTAIAATATTSTNTVNFYGTDTTYCVGTVSASLNKFGVVVNKAAAGNTFVKIVDGTFSTGW